MGCRISTSAKEPEEKTVRLSTLRSEDFHPKYTVNNLSPDERAMIALSEQKNILSMIVGGDCDRKMCWSSEPSVDDAKQDSFTEKRISSIGPIVNPAKAGLGYACRKGLKAKEQPNQDSWLILKTEGLSIYGVFDGHGKDGHSVSNFVKEIMPRLIVKSKAFSYTAFRARQHMISMLKGVFQRTHNMIAAATRNGKINAHLAGTTCTIIVHDHSNNKLYAAWTGDSGACMGSSAGAGSDGGLVCSDLTWDHKPHVDEEKARINKGGGEVRDDGTGDRVYAKNMSYPGLNMTRSMGDLLGQVDAGVTAEPTVNVFDLKAEDRVVLVCSDGVWENLSYAEALKVVEPHPVSDAMGAAESLAKVSWDKWKNTDDGSIVDDITVLVIHLNPQDTPVDI